MTHIYVDKYIDFRLNKNQVYEIGDYVFYEKISYDSSMVQPSGMITDIIINNDSLPKKYIINNEAVINEFQLVSLCHRTSRIIEKE